MSKKNLPPSCVNPSECDCISVTPVPKVVRPLGTEPVEIHHKNAKITLNENPEFSPDAHKKLDIPRPMGIGGLSSMIFVRKFRWDLEGDGLNPMWLKKVEVDYSAKSLTVELYDVITMDYESMSALDFLDFMEKHKETELTLTNYDGCGYPLYKHVFKGVVISRILPQSFDYSTSEEQTWKLLLVYQSVKTLRETKPEISPPPQGVSDFR